MEELEFRSALRQAQKGDGQAFGKLYVLVAPRIRGFLQTRGADDADALTNEVMLRAFNSIGRFSGSQSAFVGWVFQISRNALIDEARARQRRPQTVEEGSAPEDSEASIDDWHEDQQAVDRVAELLSHLSQDQADIVAMRAIAGLSYEEIAAVCGKRVGAVRATYSRGRAALRSLIELENLGRKQQARLSQDPLSMTSVTETPVVASDGQDVSCPT